MLIDTTKADASEALAAVTALLPQLDTAAPHMLRHRTIPAVMRRTIETVQRAGCDVEAGLLAVADVTAARAAMIGLAEVDDTPGAIVVEGAATECDEDGDPIDEPTPLADVRPVLLSEIDAQ
jgi:hypothetical protein